MSSGSNCIVVYEDVLKYTNIERIIINDVLLNGLIKYKSSDLYDRLFPESEARSLGHLLLKAMSCTTTCPDLSELLDNIKQCCMSDVTPYQLLYHEYLIAVPQDDICRFKIFNALTNRIEEIGQRIILTQGPARIMFKYDYNSLSIHFIDRLFKYYVIDHGLIKQFKKLVRNTLINPTECITFHDRYAPVSGYGLSLSLAVILDTLNKGHEYRIINGGCHNRIIQDPRLINCIEKSIPEGIRCPNIIITTFNGETLYDTEALKKFIVENEQYCLDQLSESGKHIIQQCLIYGPNTETYLYKFDKEMYFILGNADLFFNHVLKWCLTDNSHIKYILKTLVKREIYREILHYL